MYLNKPVDWSDPKYAKWKLPDKMNAAQIAAFFDDDEHVSIFQIAKKKIK